MERRLIAMGIIPQNRFLRRLMLGITSVIEKLFLVEDDNAGKEGRKVDWCH